MDLLGRTNISNLNTKNLFGICFPIAFGHQIETNDSGDWTDGTSSKRAQFR